MAVALPPRPSSTDGFYAINNPFLLSGPKGFNEFETLEKNLDLFVRMDFPGVPEEGMSVTLHESKKAVVIRAYAPKVHEHDSSHRSYITMTGLVCKCCEISSFTTHVSDGVLRLMLSKTGIDPHRPSCIAFLRPEPPEGGYSKGPIKFPHGTDPQDPKLTGPELKPHPNVLEGSNHAT
ncbi:hypothetical protein AALP_AAs73682U000100 [Arabis alpina]|uniref:SHSP domain-containing protein n=1 Tax=Arabis alpina TaxID=50452 RepID=A0A087FX28_ARAAL|nr:hypothetical protein AALP_AAs73682U000100 [Arabis alpina]